MKTIMIGLLSILISCHQDKEQEFIELKPKLSVLFNYSLIKQELRTYKSCKRFIFDIEGEAKEDLHIKSLEKVFYNTSFELPTPLNEEGLKRVKIKYLRDIQTQGVREHCLEMRYGECYKYSFRNPDIQETSRLIKNLENQYAVRLKQGQRVRNRIQIEKCPKVPNKVTYL